MKKIQKVQKILMLALMTGWMTFGAANAQEKFFKAVGTPHKPKVELSFNKYYTYEGLVDAMRKIAAAHPGLAKIESIGKSYRR